MNGKFFKKFLHFFFADVINFSDEIVFIPKSVKSSYVIFRKRGEMAQKT